MPHLSNAELVLVGAHGSGKSTLGRLLSQTIGAPFDDELGRHIRAQALAQNPTCDATAAQPWFDELVWRRELERDLQAKELGHYPVRRIIETWHIGNAVYAAHRDLEHPDDPARWRDRLLKVLGTHDAPIIVQPLSLSFASFQARFSEPGQDDAKIKTFLWKVSEDIHQSLSGLPVYVLPTLRTDLHDPLTCAQLITSALLALPEQARRSS